MAYAISTLRTGRDMPSSRLPHKDGHASQSQRPAKDGSEFPVDIALNPIETESGMLVYAVIRDMTERTRMEKALRENLSQLLAAQKIQEHLLPNHPPVLPGFDIAGALYPAEFAAGDHFDFLAMPNQCLGVVVADVTGHGVGPAILMASTHAHLHALAAIYAEVDEILFQANRIVADEADPGPVCHGVLHTPRSAFSDSRILQRRTSARVHSR